MYFLLFQTLNVIVPDVADQFGLETTELWQRIHPHFMVQRNIRRHSNKRCDTTIDLNNPPTVLKQCPEPFDNEQLVLEMLCMYRSYYVRM